MIASYVAMERFRFADPYLGSSIPIVSCITFRIEWSLSDTSEVTGCVKRSLVAVPFVNCISATTSTLKSSYAPDVKRSASDGLHMVYAAYSVNSFGGMSWEPTSTISSGHLRLGRNSISSFLATLIPFTCFLSRRGKTSFSSGATISTCYAETRKVQNTQARMVQRIARLPARLHVVRSAWNLI